MARKTYRLVAGNTATKVIDLSPRPEAAPAPKAAPKPATKKPAVEADSTTAAEPTVLADDED